MSNSAAAGTGNGSDPTINPPETDEKATGTTNLDIPVTDVRESQYAPSSGTVSGDTWATRGSIEDVNQRAWDQSFDKGNPKGV